jgi:chromosome segregation ATPase
MTEEAGLNTGTDGTTSTADTGGQEAGNVATLQQQMDELKTQNAQLAKDLNEQRNIQAGLDRAVAQKDKQVQTLSEQLNRYKTIDTGSTQALEDAQTQLEALSAKASELEGAQTELEQLRTVNTRMRLLMEKHPELSYLAANDALPAAQNDEEFLQKLDNISGAGGAAAASTAQSMLSGARPPASPPAGQGDQDPNDLWKQGMALIQSGDVAKGQSLIDRYWELKD